MQMLRSPKPAEAGDLGALLIAIARRDRATAMGRIEAHPSLATLTLSRNDEFLDPVSRLQAYAGHTALHAAAFAYDVETATVLRALGADVRKRNRRGAEPLHAATMGSPGSGHWDPQNQRAMIEYLIGAGADPNAAASGGVTPLHRAVRNRCSTAVEILLQYGADPRLKNHRGSTPSDLSRWTTGRGGTGSREAKAEQIIIIELLERTTPQG